MKQLTFHCLFEQSGTFKNVFKSYGHNAFDYDILNDYGKTDFQIDLFKQIEGAYKKLELKSQGLGSNIKTIFDDMKPETDFIMAFFPCTHFCDANQLQYRLLIGGKKMPLGIKEANRIIERNKDRAFYYELWIKFCYICTTLKIRTIIENPASSGSANYLVMFSPVEVAYYEKDRSLFGDNFKKPTNFFAINFEMKEKFEGMYFDKQYNTKNIYDIQSKKISTGSRSEIMPQYADNFYKRFIEQTLSE